MYWNNCWLNFFNKNNFFNKTNFLENFFYFLFTEKIYYNFFNKNFFKKITDDNIFNVFLKKKKKIFKKNNKKIKYNFTKLWFIKYNNFILLSIFCFFYFKVKKIKKKKKKKMPISKTLKIFFKKRRGNFFKKPLLKLNSNISLFF